MKGGLSLFAVAVIVLGLGGALALTSVIGLAVAIFAPLILSYLLLVKRYENRKQAFVVLVGQCVLGAFIVGMLIGKLSDNGLMVAEGIYAGAMVVFNFARRNRAPYWKKKWKEYSN